MFLLISVQGDSYISNFEKQLSFKCPKVIIYPLFDLDYLDYFIINNNKCLSFKDFTLTCTLGYNSHILNFITLYHVSVYS